MNRKTLTVACAVAMLGLLATFTSTSFALSTGSATTAAKRAAPVHVGSLIAVKTSTEYTANYTDPLYGPVSCKGYHQTNSIKFPGTEEAGGRDRFTCKSTTKLPLENLSPEQVMTWGPGAWISDYFYFTKGLTVYDTAGTGLVSKTGKSFHAFIYY